jgi:hypothetical protein
MYRIDRAANEIVPLKVCSFSELGFKERQHLQEWIAKRPEVLGEDLLVIQKEFAGFSDTSERLDLLALDRRGALVIVENKLDDAGKDVTWQAMKYASYCSSLTREGIRSIYQDYLSKHEPGGPPAEERLCDFFGVADFEELSLNKQLTQRVVLVAARFRKEVTSTVLWLSGYGLKVQCFKATPYALGDELFLNVEQVIPTPDAEEFMIGLAEKAREEAASAEADVARHATRREFWSAFLASVAGKTTLFQGKSAPKTYYVNTSSGVSDVSVTVAVTEDECRAYLYIDKSDRSVNDAIFTDLLSRRQEIEAAFGSPLIFDREDKRRSMQVRFTCGGNVYDRERWPAMVAEMGEAAIRLERALRPHLDAIKAKLKGA